MPTLTGASCRAGRALLGWSVAELQSRAKVSPNTLVDLENERREIGADVLARIAATFDANGVEILGPPRPGARLKNG